MPADLQGGLGRFFGLVGMPPEVALPLSLLLRVFNVAVTLPGAWFYGRRGMGG